MDEFPLRVNFFFVFFGRGCGEVSWFGILSYSYPLVATTCLESDGALTGED